MPGLVPGINVLEGGADVDRERPDRTPAKTNWTPSMTTEPDAELIEQGRKLFAGDWRFIWASPSIETLPPMAGLEVAFAGRSNVGKSSLINALTGRSALARTSHTPGRTQELIFFEGPENANFRLVDMPGYGYASAPKTKVASWTALIHKFLLGRATLARVYVLIDARHGIKDVDLDVLKTLDKSAVSYQVVLTKADAGQGSRPRRPGHRGDARRRWPSGQPLTPQMVADLVAHPAPASPSCAPRSRAPAQGGAFPLFFPSYWEFFGGGVPAHSLPCSQPLP